MNLTFDPQTLADDLDEVSRIYASYFASLDDASWDKPAKGGPKEWTLHETVAHLVALNGAGLESVRYALRGETYTFEGLDNRYVFNAYNRKGIDGLLDVPREELCARMLAVIEGSASLARNLRADQAVIRVQMPIYNRQLKIVEALSIIMIHTGLFHTIQVTDSTGQPPLWKQLSPEIYHRVIGRTMRAFSLLYRLDIGGALQDTIVFRVDGPGGGVWYLNLSPDSPGSVEGAPEYPGLVIRMRDIGVFSQMLTHRLNLPLSLLSGAMKLRGNLRLFMDMGDLLSVDARPRNASQTITYANPPASEGKTA